MAEIQENPFLSEKVVIHENEIVAYIERVLCSTYFRTFMFWPKLGIGKARKLGVRSKIIMFSKTVQDYGSRSADICLVMQAVGQSRHSLSMCIARSQWSHLILLPSPPYVCSRYKTRMATNRSWG